MSKQVSRPLSYDEANDRLLEAVPELGDRYRAEQEWWGEETPPPHVVFEDLLDPLIRTALADADSRILERVFEFIEHLSSSDDSRLHELVAVAVCERLSEDPAELARLRRYMGRRTRAILRQVLKR
jgi:hypothetical protein